MASIKFSLSLSNFIFKNGKSQHFSKTENDEKTAEDPSGPTPRRSLKLNDFESDKKLFSGDLKEKERELSVLVPYMRVADLIIQKN